MHVEVFLDSAEDLRSRLGRCGESAALEVRLLRRVRNGNS